MQISLATASAPGRPNEDYTCAGTGWAAILDGATAPAGVESGCIHDVRWLVRQLAAAVSSLLVVRSAPLPDLLAEAIEETCDSHAGACDVANPDSPSTTISIVRATGDTLDYLTLGDSPIVLGHGNQTFTVVADDRVSNLPGGRPYTIEHVRAHRNRAGGFWVASTQPEAAYQAVAGQIALATVSEVGLFTDGITRLLDWYGYTWPDVFSSLRRAGPRNLIDLVRAAEREQPHPHAKQHDDASAIHISLP